MQNTLYGGRLSILFSRILLLSIGRLTHKCVHKKKKMHTNIKSTKDRAKGKVLCTEFPCLNLRVKQCFDCHAVRQLKNI